MSRSRWFLRSNVPNFGRGRAYVMALPLSAAQPLLGDDLRLFATTFLGGLLFMSVYLA
ncbi:hypothetical protein H9L12_07580 [Sphingomonas rhizophila]|jgi:hypothetical protein|uniref:Uncharacterized protein n=1 Tax=Sphingomonas rhizophila TaxID=2071607 RepID=A0A7G9S8Q5_9SPHN|nr:hypothetical protein [Sphingomonas rhizophila]QNN64230.1 hypothetical protein H9L12_07580 [Sphingomonas rhizophila]